MSLFYERLRYERSIKKLSQSEFGSEINVPKQTISRWENNKNEPSFDVLVLICKFFDVTADYMLGIDEI